MMIEPNCRSEQMAAKKPSKTLIRTARRYLARLRDGKRIMRDANGRLQWTSGKLVGRRTVEHMLHQQLIEELDTDLFSIRAYGQTIGLTDDAL